LLVFLSAVLLNFLTINVIASTDFMLPPDHTSIYTIEKYGTTVGETSNQLSTQDTAITYISASTATGLASFLVKDDLTETSILNGSSGIGAGQLRQLSYELFRGMKHKKNQQIAFNWNTDGSVKIDSTYKNRTYNFTSEQNVWSRQLLPLLMSNDLQLNSQITGNHFYIVDRGSLQKYIYTLENTEDIKFSGRIYPCLKFRIYKEGSNRMSYVWLSSQHYYLPLKIEQYKDDDLNASMLLKQFKTEE